MTGRPRLVIMPGYSIFISYAHEDEALKNARTQQLRGLQRQGLIAPIIVASVSGCVVRPPSVDPLLGDALITDALVCCALTARSSAPSFLVHFSPTRRAAMRGCVAPSSAPS